MVINVTYPPSHFVRDPESSSIYSRFPTVMPVHTSVYSLATTLLGIILGAIPLIGDPGAGFNGYMLLTSSAPMSLLEPTNAQQV